MMPVGKRATLQNVVWSKTRAKFLLRNFPDIHRDPDFIFFHVKSIGTIN